MLCPRCRVDDTRVIDSRESDEGMAIRRRRLCGACAHRFTTYERLEEVPLLVAKSHGGREPFERAKIVAGVASAAKGRPVTTAQIEQIATDVEDDIRLRGGEVTSADIGLAVLERLRDTDDVAYLRFASVYKNFDAAADFERELTLLAQRGLEKSAPESAPHAPNA